MIVYNRRKAEARFDTTYRLVLCPDGCVYCSLQAEEMDHVPPLRFAHVAGADRFLYPACWPCNRHLGPLPDVCLKKRAAYLVASLRAEWRTQKAAGAQAWLLKAVECRGRLVRDRLASGEIAGLCQCVRCRPESTGP